MVALPRFCRLTLSALALSRGPRRGTTTVAAIVIAVLLSGTGAPLLHAQSISTFAGGGRIDGKPGTAIPVYPLGMCADSMGNVYIADWADNTVLRLDGSTGIVTTIAGTGSEGAAGDGGPATRASLFQPNDVAIDSSGHLYIADSLNLRIRRVDAVTGLISTLESFSGYSQGIGFDSDDNLYIAASGISTVLRVDALSGAVTTVAGKPGPGAYGGDGGPATEATLTNPTDVAIGPSGDSYIATGTRIRRIDSNTGIITTFAGNGESGFAGDGGPATEASITVSKLVVHSGGLFFADYENNRARRVDLATGIITTVAGNGTAGATGDGGPATQASLNRPVGVAVTPAHGLLIADSENRRVRRVGNDGIIKTVAGNGFSEFGGDGSSATQALLNRPRRVALDAEGNLFLSDFSNHRVRRVDAKTGTITTVAGIGGVSGPSGDGGPATQAILLGPEGLLFGPSGELYVTGFRSVRRIDGETGVITTLLGNLNTPAGLAMDDDGYLYVADSFNHIIRRVDIATGAATIVAGGAGAWAFAGDGGPATAAALNQPNGVAIDALGNLFIADNGNNRVRRVDRESGIITTFAGGGTNPYGDGGPATEIALVSPSDVAFDADGNLAIADTGNYRVRKVDVNTGILTTVVGGAPPAYAGDGGRATLASLNLPSGLAFGGDGTLYFVDSANDRIRVVYPCVTIAATGLSSPSNGSQGVRQSLALSWSPVAGAFRYDVYLDTVNPPQRIAAHDIETASISLSGLEALTTYYWHVVAKGDPFCDPFRTAPSEVWSFTTTSSCEVPGEFGQGGETD